MLVTNLLSLYVDALKLSYQERDAYWDVLSMLEQRTSAPLHRLLGHPDTCYVEYNSWQRQFILLTTPPALVTGGSERCFHVSTCLAGARKAALVWVRFDFRADALRHGGYPCFGARPAPLSRVVWLARVLPAGAPPHLPRERHTGHTRGEDLLLDQDRRLETPSTGRAAPARRRTGTGASAVRAAWERTLPQP